MHPQKKMLAVLNLVAGGAVLLSYAWGLSAWPAESVQRLWGEVPESVRPWYVSWMFIAAAGFFLFTRFLFVCVDASRVRIAERWSFGIFSVIYALILLPSATWMPLTLRYIEAPAPFLGMMIVAGLWMTGLASLALVAAIATLGHHDSPRSWEAALVGAAAFAGQTFVLDAVVWTTYFGF